MAVTRIRATAAAAAVSLLALSGCEFAAESRLEFSDVEKAKISEIRLAPGSGDVTVRTSAITEVRINRVVRYRGDEPATAHRVEGSVLRLVGDCGDSCSVSYEIEAPAGVAVRGEHGSGDVTLTDVGPADVRLGSGTLTIAGGSGPLDAETGSGDITISDMAGAVSLKAGSGSIEGRGLGGGPVTVETGSGDVSVTLDKAASVRARTGSGDVTVLVPPGEYRVRAEDDENGDDRIGVPNVPTAAHTLDVSSGSGDLVVAPR